MKTKTFLLVLMVATLPLIQSCIAWQGIGSLSAVSICGEESWKCTVGGQLGVGAPIMDFSESMSLRAELNGSLQGAGWEDLSYKGRTNLWYLNLPVVGRYQLMNGFFGELGIQPGLLLSAKDRYQGSSYDYLDFMKRFDLGIPVGVGYEFKNNIGVGLRMTPGILDISKDEEAKERNFVVALRATYSFNKPR